MFRSRYCVIVLTNPNLDYVSEIDFAKIQSVLLEIDFQTVDWKGCGCLELQQVNVSVLPTVNHGTHVLHNSILDNFSTWYA